MPFISRIQSNPPHNQRFYLYKHLFQVHLMVDWVVQQDDELPKAPR